MESDFAQGFVNSMLGWMRSLAAGVANMFKSGSGAQSGGGSFIDWFKTNWLGLFIALILLGVIVDWVVWLVRWRPYWLWFRKRRIIIDDDVDREPEPEYYYEPQERFHSRALKYDDDDIEDAGEDEPEDYDDENGDDYDDVFDDEPDDEPVKANSSRLFEDDDYEDIFEDEDEDVFELTQDDLDQDSDIVPSGGLLSRRARRAGKRARRE